MSAEQARTAADEFTPRPRRRPVRQYQHPGYTLLVQAFGDGKRCPECRQQGNTHAKGCLYAAQT